MVSMMPRYTDDQLIDLGKKAAADHPGRLTSGAFCRLSGVSDCTVRTRFGSWHNFAQRIGLAGAAPRGVSAEPDYSGRRDEHEGHHTYVVTTAYNNTGPDADFFSAIKHYAKDREAKLAMPTSRYRNPTRIDDAQRENDNDVWWHPELEPYLIGDELRVHPSLRIMGQVRIQGTSGNPLPARRNGRTKGESAIWGHSQLMMRTVATRPGHLPKVLWSTGAVTEKNYSRTDIGDSAEFHHSAAAIVVECRGEHVFMRELNWDGNSFIDNPFGRQYTAKGSRKAPRLQALIMGDTHVRQIEPMVEELTFGEGGMVDHMRPNVVIEHDVNDCGSTNPHINGKRLTEALRAMRNQSSVEGELLELLEYVARTNGKFERVWVYSNHDDMLMRWLEAGERFVEAENRELYHWLCYEMLRIARETGGALPNPTKLWMDSQEDHGVRFLEQDESYTIDEIEFGMHGDKGPNGARGSIRGLSQIGCRLVTGHPHGPGIFQGVYQVGVTGKLQQGYNVGPSNWYHAHVGLGGNGKRQMFLIHTGGYHGC